MTEQWWRIPADHPAFAGHFPGRPILPGVVLLDQAMRLAPPLTPPFVIAGLAQAKFFHPVSPDCELLFRFAPPTAMGLACEIFADGRRVASASFTLTLAP
jgi:3-hydroxymyristoyl/3-hydroxydecanoyl-(acyl carrier protein) dehydratase